MSRFSPCRSLTLEGICAECACECAMRFHHLMDPGGLKLGDCFDWQNQSFPSKNVDILRDPGFENQYANYPSGPNNTYIPFRNASTITLEWEDNSDPGAHPEGWNHQEQDANKANLFKIVTTNPRTGSVHLRYSYADSGNQVSAHLTPIAVSGGYDCAGTYTLGDGYTVTSRVSPGDLVTFKAYTTRTTTSADPLIQVRVGWHQIGAGYPTTYTAYTTTTVSHSTYQEQTLFSGVAIGTAELFSIQLRVNGGSNSTTTTDMDDFSLVIT